MDKKHEMKSIRQHIDAGQNDDAHALIQDLLNRGEEDYLLFVFAAIVASKKDDVSNAVSFYKKATELDENKPMAWQGLAKLHESGLLPADDFVFVVLDKLMILFEEQPDKRELYGKIRDQALLDTSTFGVILGERHFEKNIELCTGVVQVLVKPGREYSETERLLCEKCVARLETEPELCQEISSKCTLFKATFTDNESHGELRDFLINLSSMSCAQGEIKEWFDNMTGVMLSVHLLKTGELCPILWDVLKVKGTDDQLKEIIEQIKEKKMDKALDLLTAKKESALMTWPLCGLALFAYYKQERFEQVVKSVDEILNTNQKVHRVLDGDIHEALVTMKAEALDGMGDKEKRNKLLESQTFDNDRWKFMTMLKAVESDCTDREFDKILDENMEYGVRDCWKAARAFNKGKLSEAKIKVLIAMRAIPNSWRIIVVLAKTLIGLDCNDLNATALLLKAVKLSGPNSEIYYLLAKNLADRSRSKALGCLEMAAKIRPQHSGVAELRDKLLGIEGRKQEQLSNIERFLSVQPRCVWALKRIGLLKLQLNMIDEAVEDLQGALRLTREDKVLLSALGVAYGKRGNFESAIKTYKSLVELDSDDVHARMQLAQMYRVSGQYDEALEHCEVLNECPKKLNCASVLHADVLIRMASHEQSPAKSITLLNRLFKLIDSDAEDKTDGGAVNTSPAMLKLYGDSLMLVAKFGEKAMSESGNRKNGDKDLGKFQFPKTWPIKTAEDALRIATDAYFAVTKLFKSCTESWNDLGLALLTRARLTQEKQLAKRAVVSFKRALSTCENKQVQSLLWTNMSQAVELAGSHLASMHCLKAALLLNGNNAVAWTLLSLQLVNLNKHKNAQRALERAMKEDAKVAEAWCLQGLLNERLDRSSVIDLYGQSISLKPTKLAIERFTYQIMQSMHNGVRLRNLNLFDFEAVHDFVDSHNFDDVLSFYVALLAEHMGCYQLALDYMNSACEANTGKEKRSVHKQRIEIRARCEREGGCDESLRKLEDLYAMEKNECYEKLISHSKAYAELFDALDENDTERMRSLLNQNNCCISSPLVVAALIAFDKKLKKRMLKVVRHMCPKHALLSLYPPGSTPDDDDEFAYDTGKKGDSPMASCQFHFSQPLCELLKSRRELTETEAQEDEENSEEEISDVKVEE